MKMKGDTASKTIKVVEANQGRVLFIDRIR